MKTEVEAQSGKLGILAWPRCGSDVPNRCQVGLGGVTNKTWPCLKEHLVCGHIPCRLYLQTLLTDLSWYPHMVAQWTVTVHSCRVLAVYGSRMSSGAA